MSDDDTPPLILATNDRAARALREDLNLAERAAGKSVWRTPDVKSLRQWIAGVWADSWPSEQLLDGTQMQALWLEAVERDRHGVISATACAREAREAERIAQEYGLDLDDEPAYSDEQRAWRGWRRHIAARMREHGWLSTEHLPAIVAAGLLEGRILAPAKVQFAGLAHGVPPASRAVLDALRAVTDVSDYPELRPSGSIVRRAIAPRTLLRRCGWWQRSFAAGWLRTPVPMTCRHASSSPCRIPTRGARCSKTH